MTRIIMISFIIGSTIYAIEFYKKEKGEKETKNKPKELSNTIKNYEKKFDELIKNTKIKNTNKNKRKKEVWEKYKGMACKAKKTNCQYYFKITERTCELTTGNCKTTIKNITKKEKKHEKYTITWI